MYCNECGLGLLENEWRIGMDRWKDIFKQCGITTITSLEGFDRRGFIMSLLNELSVMGDIKSLYVQIHRSRSGHFSESRYPVLGKGLHLMRISSFGYRKPLAEIEDVLENNWLSLLAIDDIQDLYNYESALKKIKEMIEESRRHLIISSSSFLPEYGDVDMEDVYYDEIKGFELLRKPIIDISDNVIRLWKDDYTPGPMKISLLNTHRNMVETREIRWDVDRFKYEFV